MSEIILCVGISDDIIRNTRPVCVILTKTFEETADDPSQRVSSSKTHTHTHPGEETLTQLHSIQTLRGAHSADKPHKRPNNRVKPSCRRSRCDQSPLKTGILSNQATRGWFYRIKRRWQTHISGAAPRIFPSGVLRLPPCRIGAPNAWRKISRRKTALLKDDLKTGKNVTIY